MDGIPTKTCPECGTIFPTFNEEDEQQFEEHKEYCQC